MRPSKLWRLVSRKLCSTAGLVTVGIVVLAAVATTAFAVIPDSGNVIHACYLRAVGTLRVVNSASNCNTRLEIPIQWNQTGPAGQIGPVGPKGDTGPVGPAGSTGPKGDVGSTGPKGDTGSVGPKGDTGASAFELAVSNGFKGPLDSWLSSLKGPAGDTGPAGAKGDTGATGVQGPKGDTGAPGPKGDKGDTGAVGPAGAKGDTGAAGSIGSVGPIGPAGPKGDTGATGATGPAGSVGPFGLSDVYTIGTSFYKHLPAGIYAISWSARVSDPSSSSVVAVCRPQYESGAESMSYARQTIDPWGYATLSGNVVLGFAAGEGVVVHCSYESGSGSVNFEAGIGFAIGPIGPESVH